MGQCLQRTPTHVDRAFTASRSRHFLRHVLYLISKSPIYLIFYNLIFTGEWDNACNELQRMLIVRSLRQHRVSFCVHPLSYLLTPQIILSYYFLSLHRWMGQRLQRAPTHAHCAFTASRSRQFLRHVLYCQQPGKQVRGTACAWYDGCGRGFHDEDAAYLCALSWRGTYIEYSKKHLFLWAII